MQNIYKHFVGRMQRFLMLRQVVCTVTTVLGRVKYQCKVAIHII